MTRPYDSIGVHLRFIYPARLPCPALQSRLGLFDYGMVLGRVDALGGIHAPAEQYSIEGLSFTRAPRSISERIKRADVEVRPYDSICVHQRLSRSFALPFYISSLDLTDGGFGEINPRLCLRARRNGISSRNHSANQNPEIPTMTRAA